MNTWTVELPAGLPLLNANLRQHHMAKARLTKTLREAAAVCARRDKIPHFKRVHIIAEYRPNDRRRRDVHNLFPSAKAAIDGLVDAGVLTDDADEYLIGPDMRLGRVEPRGRLVLHITELTVATCGTRNGYKAHRSRGEGACDPCKSANAAYGRNYKRPRERALIRLSHAHPDEYARYLTEETAKTEKEVA
jgi:Holliday junction resolvase RusA-like endonuclease